MNSISDISGFVLGILTLLSSYHGVSGIQCYSCSYTTSSDWTVNYECVTAAANVTRGNPKPVCPTESSCFVKTVYNTGFVQVSSALRGCGKSDTLCKDSTCCDVNGQSPTCWMVCNTDLCNDMDVSIPQGFGGTNMGVRRWNNYWTMLTLTAIVLCKRRIILAIY
ncbi:hypothetical protein ACJMK2_021624 [Sinanodonta woodiana]|uniref:Uncharacterized protein n=1 Tax=Sinanodonta woodiana TaxID=1069815 RepID=A0ABD3TIL1_SINWO